MKENTIWQQWGWSYDYSQWEFAPIRTVTLSDGTRAKAAVGAPQSAVRQPSKRRLVSDVWNWHMNEFVSTDTARRNILYCDGHVFRAPMPEWWASGGDPTKGEQPLMAW